ncbi:CCA tRNA nucleotidyltransferase [Saccharibacillus sp. CPCC 101409]|uniref:CCA tRNA nucleotidyltransferase n=1 Tax=Saccharibacillus sp. CPCC 101409 TaxID=3058041 RepID=UPI0026737C4E|nr:CCA tRNA nucleotidyltransferase [Saccharibacillus sp. CPCC 101409]MDO3409638.1 CCA tRNA nucleotidyltransferase [Saccharibacillus sp. CPCC 101409]
MTQWKHAHPEEVRLSAEILRTLEQAGHEACWVGGCVRDELIGRPVNDMDIATSARPEEVTALFERTVPTGIEHGTVTVVLEKRPFEVTTFRTESEYKDFRRPEEVVFVRSLEEDLRRRDFTMNAIARGLDGRYIDPYDGRGDLARGIIRCVGDARERFREDALRMLRGVRFASVFGFGLEPDTWEALLELRGNMVHIAAERIRAELEKMLGGPRPEEGLRLLERSALLAEAKIPLPPERLAEAQERGFASLGEVPAQPAELRWAALLARLGVTGEEAERTLKSWTFSGGFAKAAAAVLRIDARMGAEEAESGGNGKAGGDAESGEAAAAEQSAAPQAGRRSSPPEEKIGGGAADSGANRGPQAVRPGAAPEDEAGGAQAERRLAFVRAVLDFGRTAAESWLLYRSAADGADEERAAARSQAAGWLAAIPAESPRELALGGTEIAEHLSRAPGPWLGALIRRLLEAAALGRAANERAALLQEIARLESEPGTAADSAPPNRPKEAKPQ